MATASLVSAQSLVEAPFVKVAIGNLVLGTVQKSSGKISAPNYISGLNITKVNGAVNTYKINIKYQIQYGDDPNLIEKALSSVSSSRQITISYGDYNASSTYKDEIAIISKVTTSLNMSASCINYTITAVSSAQALNSKTSSYAARTAKGSDIVKQLLQNKSTGLNSVFSLTTKNLSKALSKIAGDDKVIKVEAEDNVSPLQYINKVVESMTPISGDGFYQLYYDDDKEGTSLNIKKCSSTATSVDASTYSLDIGYPTTNYITGFNINTDDSWSILYDGESASNPTDYQYRIDNNGNLVTTEMKGVTKSKGKMNATSANKNWWKQVTEYPISCTVTLRGLLRPTVLMTYIKVNVLFHGQKHISSGTYVITKEEMNIDAQGFKTTLTLLRVAGD